MKNFRYYLRLALLCVVLIICVITLNTTRSWGWTANTRKTPPGAQRKLSTPALSAIGNRIKSTVKQTQYAGKPSASPAAHILNGCESFLRNDVNGTPVFMSGDAVDGLKRRMGKLSAGVSVSDVAFSFIISNREFFKLADPAEELKLMSVTADSNGDHHVLYDQYYNGIPFHGNRLTVHLDRNRIPYAFNARYSPTPDGMDTGNIRFSASQAVEKAVTGLSSITPFSGMNDFMRKLYDYKGPSAELVILENPEFPEPRLVWHVAVRPNSRDYWQYFIDARSGEIVDKYNSVVSNEPVTATAVDALGGERILHVFEQENVYYMWDAETGIYTYDAQGKVIDETGVPLITSPDNTWPDSIAVSAHSNTRLVLDYFENTHNRRGLDGNGADLPQIVHFTDNGEPMYNAFWGGGFVAYGDADIFAAALDVVAHEMTHGVVEYTVGLEYRFQSGALNESFADAMASMVDPDWEMGEDLRTGPHRDMLNPERFGLPAHMDDFCELTSDQDNGGVHINMSIPARACVLTAEAIGREKTARIWYRILGSRYLTPKSQFIDMRYAAIQSAEDLYGTDSAEVTAVINAFDNVGIADDEPSEPPEDLPPAKGEPRVAFVLENRLALAEANIESVDDIVMPTETEVFTEGSSPVTVSSDGSFLLFIDSENNLRYLDLETFDEKLLDGDGDWSSIALSPDGNRLAATTTYADTTIYILDLENPENSKAITLYTASTEGVFANTAIFADALDWDRSGKYLLYDAFHQLPISGGNPVEFWDVNLLDVDYDIITRIKTHSDYRIQVGNPSYAETNDRYIVCDLFYNELNFNVIVAIDLFNLDINILHDSGKLPNGYPNLGFPKYSPDDTSVIFQHYNSDSGKFALYRLPVASDKMTINGDEERYWDGELPAWYVHGEVAFLNPPSNFIVSDPPDDQGHKLFLTWEPSPDEANGDVEYYRIYRSRSEVWTEPIHINEYDSLDSLIYYEEFYTTLIDSVTVGENEYLDECIPFNGVPYYYWIQAVGNKASSAKISPNIKTIVDQKDIPSEFSFFSPYPNPFNPSTTIEYDLTQDGHVMLSVYTTSGQRVCVLEDRVQHAGHYAVTWNASNMPSGLYFCTLKTNGIRETKKMVLIK